MMTRESRDGMLQAGRAGVGCATERGEPEVLTRADAARELDAGNPGEVTRCAGMGCEVMGGRRARAKELGQNRRRRELWCRQ